VQQAGDHVRDMRSERRRYAKGPWSFSARDGIRGRRGPVYGSVEALRVKRKWKSEA